MRTARWIGFAMGLALVTPSFAQMVQSRRASMHGDFDGEGKCTIEVEVDDVAEVEIRGDMGRIRTMSGQPSNWRRFECNAPMPFNPAEFRFKGIDGRGHQSLLRDPRQNGGTAVVRIEDRDGGREGYTFDLIWRGGTMSRGGGFDPAPYRPLPPIGANRDTVMRACKDAVADRARDEFRVRDIDFRDVNYDDRIRDNDRVIGSFDARSGGIRERYNFVCRVDGRNGRIRDVDVSPMATTHTPGRSYRDDPVEVGRAAIASCRNAVADRLRRDGYFDVDVRSASPDLRAGREESVLGRATGRRGGREIDFDYVCSVEFSTGRVRGITLDPRR